MNWSTTVRNVFLSIACGSVNARGSSYSISKEIVKLFLLNRMCGRGEEKESEKEKEIEGRKRREAWQFSEVKWGRQLYPGVVVVLVLVGRGGSHIRDASFMLFVSLGNPSPVLSTFLQNSLFPLCYQSLYAPLHEYSTFIFFPPRMSCSLLTLYVFPSICIFSVWDRNCV